MPDNPRPLELTVDGRRREAVDDGGSLLDVLRWQLGVLSPKDGCSPQGQCGCCTVLIDGQPRVACVTPARRVAGRSITTLDGIEPDRRNRWCRAFGAVGASQCGFCTPGIVVRLDRLARGSVDREPIGRAEIDRALAAHLCRCTGWQTIVEAVAEFEADGNDEPRDLDGAAERARIEGGIPQVVGPEVVLGRGGFAADTAPPGSLLALSTGDDWVVGETIAEARAAAARVQGRRTTAEHRWPIDVPDGDWAATLRTTWVEPAYLETDASWCEPGGVPWSAVANGGAFGAKLDSPVPSAARRLADEHGRPVLALASREDTVRWGPKRPPVAGGAQPDGTGVLRVAATDGIADIVGAVAPGLEVVEVPVVGPPTSSSIRGAGWVEALVLTAGAGGAPGPVTVTAPGGGTAMALVEADRIVVTVQCGRALDPVTLRSYCVGAAHMAWSWLTSEALTVDDDGSVHDLTIRSFGVVRSADTPSIEIDIVDDDRDPVNGSEAVFAAVAAAGWIAADRRQDWPVGAIIVPPRRGGEPA